ncbi:MAG: choline-sulfatase [Alphaproteobacteria bacterium]|nr:choline-sulfatase [Alphaproteobacteria bacterium]
MRRRPNILILMADQLAGTFFPDGPCDWLHVPHLKTLADRCVRFTNAYTASPLCTSARASFMSGRLPSRTRVYDNAAEFASDIPTFAHHLRGAGYQTCLSGKMHFIGADQLHGFEDRLTTDIYPADFGWTPDYRRAGERIDWWYHNLGSVTGAGIAEITNQLEFDDEVASAAIQRLYQLSRGLDDRPWLLTVSFTHPHDPYVARRRFWDLYADCAHLEPEVPALADEDQDPHARRLLHAVDHERFDISDDDIRRARRGYFANISYLDEKIGQILDVLETTRQAANTAIVVCADHGDMLGERGLWFKMCFYEGSARIPLMISAPGLEPRRVDNPVSLLDIAPTLADLADVALDEIAPGIDGESLLPLISGAERTAPVVMEYAAEGSHGPLVALRQGRWKYVHCELDPPQLFDLETDPHETANLATEAAYAETATALADLVASRWDLAKFDAEVRDSQARRHIVYQALRQGRHTAWDFEPAHDAARRFMRNDMDLNVVEERNRFPRGE